MKLLNCLRDNRHWPKRVLGISKLSAYEFLKITHSDLSQNQLLSQLRKQNIDPDEILAEHHRQLACEKELARILHNLNVNCQIMKRIGDARCVDWADLVITIGGDGTFLLASKLITNNKTPIFGINPHPETSNTFTLPINYSTDIERIFEKLHAGDYTVLMRSRIRTVMTGEGLYQQPFHVHEKSRVQGEKRVDALMRSTQRKIADALQPRRRILPWLALNEVFMAEFLASRPIMLTIQADEEERFMIRSSGICVCTGSGSRSWFRTMNLQTAETVQTLVAMATGRQLNEKETREVLHKYHSNLLFPPDNLKMAYMIYEMSRSPLWPKLISDKRMCCRIKIKSTGFDAGLVLDGCVSLPFNDGSTASFEIRPEYSLKNIILQ
ncbi:PREDICTED: NAD kinase 2, mitochondrial-like [Cyphomyrmex costatus]|uniref:NAD kinase 2, mitochondrial-like n=1 Tax=Cyphomyrmex costatus TaxID=456900 RepID=UPI0008522DED|nr:PREDICTED: NAD kinase 2, mitochondrial-like [Cyphomyrmex costatus]